MDARALLLPTLIAVIVSGSATRNAWSQDSLDQVPAERMAAEVVVCPPRFSTPMYVPAEELLRDAKKTQPVTAEGWIVRQYPVADCVNYTGDAAQRSYELFEYPLRLRRYDSQIRSLEAEIGSLQRKLANYEYFNKAGALLVTVENTRLALQAAQQDLRDLRYERRLFVRWQQIERQLGQGVVAND